MVDLKESLLQRVEAAHHLPFASLRMQSSTDASVESVAIHYAVLDSHGDSVADVRKRSDMLCDLEDEGWIRAEYPTDVDLEDYIEFYESNVYKELCQMVEQNAGKEGFVLDKAVIVKGTFTLDVDEKGSPNSKSYHGHTHGDDCGCGGDHSHSHSHSHGDDCGCGGHDHK